MGGCGGLPGDTVGEIVRSKILILTTLPIMVLPN